MPTKTAVLLLAVLDTSAQLVQAEKLSALENFTKTKKPNLAASKVQMGTFQIRTTQALISAKRVTFATTTKKKTTSTSSVLKDSTVNKKPSKETPQSSTQNCLPQALVKIFLKANLYLVLLGTFA